MHRIYSAARRSLSGTFSRIMTNSSANGMNADGRIEGRLGSARLKRDTNTLDDLAGLRSHHMDTEYRIRLRMYNELHQGPLVSPGKRMFKRLEIRHIDIDFPMLIPGLCLGQTNRADVRLAEHRRWNVGVVDRP